MFVGCCLLPLFVHGVCCLVFGVVVCRPLFAVAVDCWLL